MSVTDADSLTIYVYSHRSPPVVTFSSLNSYKLLPQEMNEEFAVDPAQLLGAASDFSQQLGAISDASAQEFLNRFPLPAIIGALQTDASYPGLESALVECLERIFRTKYGASLIPHFMPFVIVGLGADSQKVKRLACICISCLLENTDRRVAVQLVLQNDIYPLLLGCLIDGDEQVAAASTDAIKGLASYPESMGIVFPANVNEATHLGNIAAKCSSLGRVRVLALIVKLFSISRSAASEVSKSNLLSLLEAEVKNTNDTLVTLSVLELIYELVEVQHSAEFLSKTILLQLLSSIISNGAAESILRSRAMMITGRLLSKENAFAFIDESSFKNVLSAIDKRFEFLESQDADECECALEALGQIGSSFQGATMVLSNTPPIGRHVVDAAFDRQQHGKQLAALHSLANIAGETRMGNNVFLTSAAEENLKSLIYDKASKTPKLIPSGLLLSVLQQDSEIRVAGYRLISGLVARTWCLIEIISRPEIIEIVTDTLTETNKIGMEARHKCCETVLGAFTSSSKLVNDPAYSGLVSKLQEAIRNGPYGARKRTEAQPQVATADRF
ncbi:ARM repeat superfamily protein [Perilla frutescens var. hirtella]|uniref:ARM repeat superfamily protein n=1 Tax=Perilla frutescens var. hirtella TaxID=608512 RepID=A0AAD4JKJ2_PERFH|nr:ARM repeat superfamily protein [Perilla frutescens var. hirtella]